MEIRKRESDHLRHKAVAICRHGLDRMFESKDASNALPVWIYLGEECSTALAVLFGVQLPFRKQKGLCSRSNDKILYSDGCLSKPMGDVQTHLLVPSGINHLKELAMQPIKYRCLNFACVTQDATPHCSQTLTVV